MTVPPSRLTLDRCSLNTATLGYRMPIRDTIEMVARQGFGAITPWRREVEPVDVHVVARQIRDAGLKVSGYCRSSAIPATTPQAFRQNVEDNRRALRDAAELGADCFVVVVGGLPDGTKDLGVARDQVAEGLAFLLDDARRLGVQLALEPLHPMYAADRSCLNSLGQALDLCEALDPDRDGGVGVAFDVYHVWWDPALVDGLARIQNAKRSILAFHVCDWLVPTCDLLMDRGMMGDGVIEIARLRAAVEAIGYCGFVEVEIFSHAWWRQPASTILQTCKDRLLSVC